MQTRGSLFHCGGNYDTTSLYHGFIYTIASRTFTDLEEPNAGNGTVASYGIQGTTPLSINDSGSVTGYYVDSSGNRHGFIYSAGNYTSFDVSGATTLNAHGGSFSGTIPMSIDSAGDVAGSYTDSSFVRHGFIRSASGVITTFDAPGAGTSGASGTIGGTLPTSIDPTGSTIAGVYDDSSGLGHGFVYYLPLTDKGSFTSFPPPNMTTSTAFPIQGADFSVNASGTVVGFYLDNNEAAHGFEYASTPTPAPTFNPPQGTYSSAQSVTISDTDSSAAIYYTTDGSTPTLSSTKYTGPVSVSSSETLTAIALDTTVGGYIESAVVSAAYTIGSTVGAAATPTFTPPAGTYATAQTVTILDNTPGATIYYTTDGIPPTTNSTLYVDPIEVSSSETIEAIAVATGYSNSAVASAAYTISSANPQGFILYSTVGNVGGVYSLYPNSLVTVDPASGTQQLVGQPANAVNVAWLAANPVNNLLYGTGLLSTNSDVTLYAIDPSSGAVSSQVTLSQSVSAIAVSPQGALYGRSGNTLGTINSATGQFSPLGTLSLASGYFLEAMTFSQQGTLYGVEENGQSGAAFSQHLITLNPANGALMSDIGSLGSYVVEDITYAQDGNIYATNFSYALLKIDPQSASNTLIGLGNIGDLEGIAALAAPLTATPAFSIAPGTYASPQTVTITDATSGATIYYTTNGTTPSTASAAYSGPITVSSSETIEAIAAASGYANSTVAVAQYTINLPAPDFQLSVSPSSLSIARGQSGTAVFTVTPVNGFNSAVSFSCSGLPAEATCTFSPATVTPDGSPVTSTLTIRTTAPASAFQTPLQSSRRLLYAGLFPFFASWFAFAIFRARRRLGAPFWGLLILLLVSAGLASCGGGGGTGNSGGGDSGTPLGTSTVSISASAAGSGAANHAASVTITITQ